MASCFLGEVVLVFHLVGGVLVPLAFADQDLIEGIDQGVVEAQGEFFNVGSLSDLQQDFQSVFLHCAKAVLLAGFRDGIRRASPGFCPSLVVLGLGA